MSSSTDVPTTTIECEPEKLKFSFAYIQTAISAILIILCWQFAITIYSKRQGILKYHDTISSFCAYSHNWENRFLLMLCIITSANLMCLHFEEFNARGIDDHVDLQIILFIVDLLCIASFPLVGIFYTRGNHPDTSRHNKDYECPHGTCNIETSEKLHKCGAMGFFCGLSLTSIVWSVVFLLTWDEEHHDAAIGLTVWSVSQLIMAGWFGTIQAVLVKKYRVTDVYDRVNTEEVDDIQGIDADDEEENDTKKNEETSDIERQSMETAKISDVNTEQRRYRMVATKLRYVSFFVEAMWGASVVALTTTLCLIRNEGLDWNWTAYQ
eukprot:123750_1